MSFSLLSFFDSLYFTTTSTRPTPPTSRTATAAPIPPRLSRQPPNTFNGTFFPYIVSGPVPPLVHQPGSVLDTCSTENTYAISFDDGPGQLTDELLDFLDEQNLKVTFFVNGDNWSCVYSKFICLFACEQLARRLLKSGTNDQVLNPPSLLHHCFIFIQAPNHSVCSNAPMQLSTRSPPTHGPTKILSPCLTKRSAKKCSGSNKPSARSWALCPGTCARPSVSTVPESAAYCNS